MIRKNRPATKWHLTLWGSLFCSQHSSSPAFIALAAVALVFVFVEENRWCKTNCK